VTRHYIIGEKKNRPFREGKGACNKKEEECGSGRGGTFVSYSDRGREINVGETVKKVPKR